MIFSVEPPKSMESLSQDVWFPKGIPWACVSIGADNEKSPDWLPAVANGTSKALFLSWKTTPAILLRPSERSVQIEAGPHLPPLPALLARLTTLPMTVCSLGSVFAGSSWKRQMRSRRFYNPSLNKTHGLPGVAVGIKGEEGHGRLVSRRWLTYGPWALLRYEPSDLSVVLFHDPDATDAEQALKDATPGHFRMGMHPDGGYLQPGFPIGQVLEGTYLENDRRFIVLIAGRDLRPDEMLDACLHRRDSQQSDNPIDTVSFVFFDPETAKRHLHELWLRELECRILIDGVEVRLDENYVPPPPSPPPWAAAVREKWESVLYS